MEKNKKEVQNVFAIKTEPGSERRMARVYTNGFLPTYSPAPTEETKGKKIKKLIVPGYVFVLNHIRGAERVMDEEWKMIEALSENKVSTIDEHGQIVDGPLTGLDEIVAKVEGCKASIHVSLLGKWRWYEIEVLRTVASEDQQTEQHEAEGAEKKMAEKKTYTEEELNAAIEKAKEVGIHKAARESSIPWQTIMGAARKAGVEIEPKKTNKKREEKKAAETKAAEQKAAEPKAAEKKTPAKKGRKAEAAEKPAPAPAAEEPAAEEAAASPLEIENAVLRAENQKLKAKIEKLQKAIADLI